ncbi:MAG: hypothetical protein GY714_18110 [Desulfobacterales bacterium]|nr:hypothetical protein [Desulfobacterales bacterium]
MAFWAAIPMIASTGSGIAGQKAAQDAAISGAESSARIEQMNREYQQKVFDKNIEAQKPFYEAGKTAIDPYARAVRGEGNAMSSGLAQMQKGLLAKDTASMSDYVKNLTSGRLEAEEGEKYKGRLLDLQQIGLGVSGSAGRTASNLGTSLAQSYAREGQTELAARMGEQTALSNMWTQTMDTLSGLPAYYEASKGQQSSRQKPDYGYGSGLNQPYGNNIA